MSFLKALRGKDNSSKQRRKAADADAAQPAPAPVRYEDPWIRDTVNPQEISDLLKACTAEIKSRGLSTPFLLLPYRPTTEPTSGRTLVRNYFNPDPQNPLRGERLARELRLTDVTVICSVMKWCWGRLPGGVVSWETYELFRVGEQDSDMSRNSFTTFIPMSVDCEARASIIFDFFELMSAIAANGKHNGFGGMKLSRLAGWWAFDHSDGGLGFEGGYMSWLKAADATSHLFFAYLRSLSPGGKGGGVSVLPLSLQQLMNTIDYPPMSSALYSTMTRVVMTVETVSPTPFALLRRARHFEYRDDDRALQEFSDFEDPVEALTEECKRVLRCISSANTSKAVTTGLKTGALGDESWSRFQDMGFSVLNGSDDEGEDDSGSMFNTGSSPSYRKRNGNGARKTNNQIGIDLARPTTPSWADFMASGFAESNTESQVPPPMLLSPDKLLPQIETSRVKSSASHRRLDDDILDPGELASIAKMKVDDAFWWVWMTSLAPEETSNRKSAFGRCAMIETTIRNCGWIIVEEKVKGAASNDMGEVYMVGKKKSKRSRTLGMLTRRKSSSRADLPSTMSETSMHTTRKKSALAPELEAKVKSTAQSLKQRHQAEEMEARPRPNPPERDPEKTATRTSSIFNLQPVILSEASQALKWASKYDKDAIREAYLNGATEFPVKDSDKDRELPAIPKSNPDVSLVPTPSKGPSRAVTPPPPPPAAEKSVPSPTTQLERAALDPHHYTSSTAAPPAPKAAAVPKAADVPKAAAVPKAAVVPTPVSPPAQKSTQGHIDHNAPIEAETDSDQDQTAQKAAVSPVSSPEPPKQVLQKPEPQSPGDKGKKPSRLRKMFGTKKDKAPASGRATSPTSMEEPIEALEVPDAVGRNVSYDEQLSPPAAPAMNGATGGNSSARGSHSSIPRMAAPEPQVQAPPQVSQFGQGPMDDMPAFIPDDSPPSSPSPPPVRAEPVSPPAPAPVRAPVSPPAPAPVRAPVSPTGPVQIVRQPPGPGSPINAAPDGQLRKDTSEGVQDRWAQIRKNAAERAKATQQKDAAPVPDTRRISNDNDVSADEGETSGEETIESRVARIKARVAELTGNMDTAAR